MAPSGLQRLARVRAIRASKLVAPRVIGVALWLLAGAASSDPNVSSSIHCPPSAEPDSAPTIDVRLENREDATIPVRILSGFTANANGTAAGVAVRGPVVAANEQVAGDSVRDLAVAAPPAIPASLGNRMATYVIVSEWDGGAKRESSECLIFVPEPSRVSAATLGMLVCFHLRRARLRRRSEVRS